jgi:hypothetical protein
MPLFLIIDFVSYISHQLRAADCAIKCNLPLISKFSQNEENKK